MGNTFFGFLPRGAPCTGLSATADVRRERLRPGPPGPVPYLNFYLPNGGVVVPVAHGPQDEEALEQIRVAFPGREMVPVSGECQSVIGGGGPHCITQQVPVGVGIA